MLFQQTGNWWAHLGIICNAGWDLVMAVPDGGLGTSCGCGMMIVSSVDVDMLLVS